MKSKSVVLLSSGLDSSVNFAMAVKEMNVLAAINFDYGQRAAVNERKCAREQVKKYGINLLEIDLPFFSSFKGSALTNASTDLAKNMNIHDIEECTQTAKNVWVPNRNGIFLNIAAAIAENLDAKYIIPGFNIEEATTFPDNSKDYLQSLNKSLYYSTANHVEVFCFTTDKNKKEIYHLGKTLGVDYTNVWYCYENNEKPCGECESCLRFFNASKDDI